MRAARRLFVLVAALAPAALCASDFGFDGSSWKVVPVKRALLLGVSVK